MVRADDLDQVQAVEAVWSTGDRMGSGLLLEY